MVSGRLSELELYSLVDISRIQKNIDSRLSTDSGISDIAIISPDFVLKEENTGVVYGFVEVKSAGVSLRVTSQILGQMKKLTHFIHTNGIVWRYYCKQKMKWEKNLCKEQIPYSTAEITIDKDIFEQLRKEIQIIQWEKTFD